MQSATRIDRPAEGISKQSVAAAVVIFGAGIVALIMSRTEAILAPLWLLGIMAGFTLQRSRFCFASAFRDLFLFGNSRIMKGIIVGLGIATFGFAIIMYNEVPFPSFGVIPQQANVLPVGISTVTAGLMFGFGMVISGGCVSGSLYRMAEGYVASWVSIFGVIIGMGLLSQTWIWWWDIALATSPRVWIPSKLSLGYGGSAALSIAALLGVFLLTLRWEARSGLSMPNMPSKDTPSDTWTEKLSAIWQSVFIRGWPAVVGGAVLGCIGVFMYMTHMPWGVTGELARWSNAIMTTLNIPPPEAMGMSDIGGCAGRAGESGLFTHTFAVTVGVLPGALVGALFSKEFKVRFPQNPKRYIQALGGGVIMGYGAGLAVGCTVGAFFSSIPSLSLSGWIFALALAGGAYVGVQAIKRIG